RVFTARVGASATRVKAARYGSPLFALAGVVTFGTSLRRRKLLSAVEGEDEGEEVEEAYEGDRGVEAPVAAPGADVRGAPPAAEADTEEEVTSTLYAPGQAAPGDAFLVQV